MQKMNEITYEQSLMRLKSIQAAISSATEMRDYERAKSLQLYLQKQELLHSRLFEKHQAMVIGQKMAQIESDKLDRESDIIRKVIEKLNDIYNRFDQNYADLERRHMMTIEDINIEFNSSKFTNVRFSTTIRQLEKAESYYAGKKDFLSASQIKRQIEKISFEEVNDFNRSIRSTKEAKIRDAENHYRRQQKIFRQRLNTEKNILKKEIKVQIYGIDNRFKKIKHGVCVGNQREQQQISNFPEEQKDNSFEQKIMQTIDYEIDEYYKKLENQFSNVSKVQLYKITDECKTNHKSHKTNSSSRSVSCSSNSSSKNISNNHKYIKIDANKQPSRSNSHTSSISARASSTSSRAHSNYSSRNRNNSCIKTEKNKYLLYPQNNNDNSHRTEKVNSIEDESVLNSSDSYKNESGVFIMMNDSDNDNTDDGIEIKNYISHVKMPIEPNESNPKNSIRPRRNQKINFKQSGMKIEESNPESGRKRNPRFTLKKQKNVA